MIGTRYTPRYADHSDRREQLIGRALHQRSRPPDLQALLLVGRFPPFRALDRIEMLLSFPDVEEILKLTTADVELTIGRPLRRTKWDPRRLLHEIQADETWLAAGNDRRIVWIGDEAYPRRLRRIYDAPAVLYAWGDLNACGSSDDPVIAAVGTRTPDRAGIEAAFALGRELAEVGAIVPSGLALGIDGAVHRGVVTSRLSTGRPVAVLGSGIDTIYPRQHRDLAADILSQNGVILSEYPPGRAPAKHHFPARNRIVVGLSDAVVLVQAPEHSGALISAELAHDIGIDVVVHTVGAEWTGGKELIAVGAPVIGSAYELLKTVYPNRSEKDVGKRSVQREEILEHPALKMFGPTTASRSIGAFRRTLRRRTTTTEGSTDNPQRSRTTAKGGLSR